MPPQLTAVAFIRLVITVGITITAPACVDAQATVTHEFPRAAGLVGRWETKGSRGPHGRAESPVSHPPPTLQFLPRDATPLSACPSWHLCPVCRRAAPPPLLPAGQSTHSSQTRPTSLRSHRRRHSGICPGCSGHRHTETPPGCKEERALLRLKGRAALRP